MLTNHFLLSPELRIYRSDYEDERPGSVVRHVRAQGLDAEQRSSLVRIYHGPALPKLRARMVGREELKADADPVGYVKAINSHLSFSLCQAGFVSISIRSREFLHPTKYVQVLNLAEDATLRVGAHLRWSWDIECYNNQYFLVPLPGRHHLTTYDLLHENVSAYLARQWNEHADDPKHFPLSLRHLQSGRHARLVRKDEGWHIQSGPKSFPIEPGWHLTLDMVALQEIDPSSVAHHSAEFSFAGLVKMLRDASPFSQSLASSLPLQISATKVDTSKAHIRFMRGSSNNLQDVHKLGLLEHPPQAVRLAVLAPTSENKEDKEHLKNLLRVHLLSRAQAELHAPDGIRLLKVAGGQDTIFTLWSRGKYGSKLGLKPFDVANGVHYYDPKTGKLASPESFDVAKEKAGDDGRRLIAFALMNPSVTILTRDTLFQQLKCFIEPLDISTLQDNFPSWLSLTVRLAQRAGGVPWDLMNIPGVDESTVFLGIDLGHEHKQDYSNLAVTLFNHQGRPVNQDVFRLGHNDERIPELLLKGGIPRFIKNSKLSLSQVIIHRDGYFSEEEKEAISAGMLTIPGVSTLTLVSIKKDTKTRFDSTAVEGNYWITRPNQAVLLTNSQAEDRSMPAPLEVELTYSNTLDLHQAVAQVHWLSRVYTGSVFHSKRLPVTTWQANNIATTGKKVHLKGWDKE